MAMDLWVEERQDEVVAVRYRVDEVLFRGRSEFQEVEVIQSAGLGRILLNDGIVQVSERDERVYHEMIVHVPLFTHPAPRRVLVIGGGDGGTVREILRHPGVERVRMIEIDRLVVDACRQHIPQTAACLDDPRVDLRFEDGVAYVATTEARYDVVIVDSSDPIGPAEVLFGEEFYRQVARVLSDDGLVVSQAESPWYEAPTQKQLLGILGRHFPRVRIYDYGNLTYPGGHWSFSLASKGPCPVADLDAGRVERAGLEMFYYSAEVHRAAFALPAFQARALADLIKE